jgi:putative ribosome biogenesis GTPase RsgA
MTDDKKHSPLTQQKKNVSENNDSGRLTTTHAIALDGEVTNQVNRR